MPCVPHDSGSPQTPGATTPRAQASKAVEDETFAWWDMTELLIGRCAPYAESFADEGIDYVADFSVLLAGSEVASRTDLSETRFVEIRNRYYVKTRVKGGADDTDYTLELKVVTTHGRTLTARALLKVRNLDEACAGRSTRSEWGLSSSSSVGPAGARGASCAGSSGRRSQRPHLERWISAPAPATLALARPRRTLWALPPEARSGAKRTQSGVISQRLNQHRSSKAADFTRAVWRFRP